MTCGSHHAISMTMSQISDNLDRLTRDIAKTADEWGRAPESVNLVAVSKKQPEERIEAALAAGHRLFGENRVQEAQERWEKRRADYPDLTLHLIGPLQTNKVKDAVALFDVIETLDRPKLARKLAKEMANQDRRLPCFIQVNTGKEDQKSGVMPEDVPELLNIARQDCGLNIVGLMCIPPLEEPPGLHFAFLKQMADDHGLSDLSMGMSGDYDKAIAAGATYIRVGTGIFGKRPE